MTYLGAIRKIKKDWGKYPHEIKDKNEAVWIVSSDNSESYEVDEEWIGMKGDGTLVWAYASACSCWDGDYESKPVSTIKSFEFNHKEMEAGWKKAIIKFAETSECVKIQLIKMTTLRKHSKNPVAQCKVRIQGLCRSLAIMRDGGCVLRNRKDVPPCNGYRNDGELILQYDHLNSRVFNVSYADIRLGVILCLGHHGWKKWNKEKYDILIREVIGKKRAELWDRVKKDKKTYRMELWDWTKVEIGLTKDLKDLI